jgi:WD40-like Beta Propeller Repeat
MADQLFEAYEPEELRLARRIRAWTDEALAPIDPISIAHEVAARSARVGRRGRIAGGVTTALHRRPLVLVRRSLLVIVALLTAVAVGGVLLSAGSRGPKLPPPFGPARNGVMVVGLAGDLVQLDPATGKTLTLRSGGTLVGPVFSPDGRQILFQEVAGSWEVPRVLSSLWVMDADGSGARRLLPVGRYSDPAWAPDGDRILVAGGGWLFVIDVASGISVRHSLGIDIESISWRPNHEQALLSVVNSRDTYLVNADGTGLRSLPALAAWGDWSPDGSTIVYNVPTGPTAQDVYPDWIIHLLDVDSGVDRELTFDGHPGSNMVRGLSPDGTRLLVWRRTGIFGPSCGRDSPDCEYYRPMLVPVAGGGPEVRLGSFDVVTPGEGGGATFSPDGKQLLGIYSKDPRGVWLYDADTGEETAMTGPPWESQVSGMTWQRLAP